MITLSVLSSLVFLVLVRGDIEPVKQVGDIKYGVFLEPREHVMKRQTYESLRITFYYDDSVNTGLSADVRDRIQNNIIPELKSFAESNLSVKRTGAPILIDRDCNGDLFVPSNTAVAIQCASTCADQTMCGTTVVPDDHLKECIECNGGNQCATRPGSTSGPGVDDTDFLLYVSAITTGTCSSNVSEGSSPSTVAFASSCAMESTLDRPIAGSMNFCPAAFSGTVDDAFILDVAKHEILHALAFSQSLYPFWRNETGDPRSTRNEFGFPPMIINRFVANDTTIREVTYTDWMTQNGPVSHTVTLLVTPNVVEIAKDYFNCSTLEGVELENQGGTGTAISHWEKRILGNELMTGLLTDNPTLSIFTLALLEDSGWYRVNYENASELLWGRGAGCEFAQGSCFQYLQADSTQSPPFCTGSSLGCTVDRLFIGSCGIAQYNQALPADYQYFSDPQIGGVIEIIDYCPFYKSFSFANTSRNTECSNANNQPPVTNTINNNVNAETYGGNSRCFEHNNQWRLRGSPVTNYGAGCYTYTCDANATVLTINILGTQYDCTAPNQILSISVNSMGFGLHEGELRCPSSFASLCEEAGITVPTQPTTTQPTQPTTTRPAATPTATPSSASHVFSCLYLVAICMVAYILF